MQARLIAVVLVTAALLGCEGTDRVSSPPMQGRVIDEAGAPIDGAIVYARWNATVVPKSFTAHNSPHICYYAETAVSTADGAFSISGWARQLDFKVREPTISIAAYKRGYAWLRTDDQTVRMRVLAGGPEQQLDELRKRMAFCMDGGVSERNLYGLFKTLYYDAHALPPSAPQQGLVEALRQSAATVWVDSQPNAPPGTRDRRMAEFLEENLK